MSKESLKVQEQIELIKNLEFKPDFVINIKVLIQDLHTSALLMSNIVGETLPFVSIFSVQTMTYYKGCQE